MVLSEFLMPVSSLLLLATLIIYGFQVHKGHNNPSIYHLSLCNFVLLVNVPTYIFLSKDFWASSLAFISSFGSLLIFFIFLRKGEYHPLSKVEKVQLIFIVISFCFSWFIFGNGIINLATHLVILISSLKNYFQIRGGKVSERELPCYLSFLAYLIMGVCMLPKAGFYELYKLNFGQFISFIYMMFFPVSRLISNTMILLAIKMANKEECFEQ